MQAQPSTPPPRTYSVSDAPADPPPPAVWNGERDSHGAISLLVSPEQLSVVFQPIVHLETGQLFACEAQLGQGFLFAPPAFPLPTADWPPQRASQHRDGSGTASTAVSSNPPAA